MNDIIQTIASCPIVPVYYHADPDTCIKALELAYKTGIRVFEFVNRGEQAQKNFEILKSYRDNHLQGMSLGIGTIKNKEQAETFLSLGADFIVSPIVLAEIAEAAQNANKPWIPGTMTPTEIELASRLGASVIKIFPANILGPQYIKGIKPLFPELKFMVTGGISADFSQIKTWYDAGVFAVGLGSLPLNNPDEEQNIQAIVQSVIQLQSAK